MVPGLRVWWWLRKRICGALQLVHYPFPPGKLRDLLRLTGKEMLFISVSTLLSGPLEKLGLDQVQFR